MHASIKPLLLLACASTALAHGSHGDTPSGNHHEQKPLVDPSAPWITRHMAEEHHAESFDAASFFSLHDYDSDGRWEPTEIQRTYGLMDESNAHVPESRRNEIVKAVLGMFDKDGDGVVSREEWVEAVEKEGKTLEDYGTGPGHHGDDEYEYEIHHWEKYHDENTKLEDLTHPEDIEHFKKHEQMEEEEERIAEMAKHSIVLENIPDKFRRRNY